MSSDDSLAATGPARTSLRTTLLLALLTFVLGIAATALIIRQYRSWFPVAAQAIIDPVMTGPAEPRPAGAGFEPPPEAGSAARSLDREQLDARQTAIAAQVATLEARTALIDQDTRAAAGNATRAEALLIAFAARRAIDRGLALGSIEPQLRLRFGNSQPRAVTRIIQAARTPVTIEDLRQGLDELAPELATGAATDGWFNSLRREVANLIIIRHEGTPSPRAADRLVRVRRLLDAGRIEAALAEVGRLPGAPKAALWIEAAGRYVETHEALDTIETVAILGPANDMAARAGAAMPSQAMPSQAMPGPATGPMPAATAPAAPAAVASARGSTTTESIR